MNLHCVFITYNRLELTKRAIESFLETVELPYSYLLVDNGSKDGTQEWLQEEGHPHLLLGQNHYPGYACNRGWEMAPKDATHFQRADNDMAFLPGWCEEVKLMFTNRRLGQLGLRTDAEENNITWNVGGNCIISRRLFDKGLRYDERPWRSFPAGLSEDTYFSPDVRKMGYRWGRVTRGCLESLASGDWNDPYYAKSYGDRRIRRPRERRQRHVATKTTKIDLGPGYGPEAPVPVYQWQAEFDQLLVLYRDRKPKRVLEIGTYHGGTLYHWLQNAQPGAEVVSVDSYAVGIDNRHLYAGWVPDGVELHVIKGDSSKASTVSRVEKHAPYDWCFIDAGHYYAEVKSDWELYAPIIEPGGICVFHDILPPSVVWPDIEVERLWREIQRDGFLTREIVDDPEAMWGGLGIVFL